MDNKSCLMNAAVGTRFDHYEPSLRSVQAMIGRRVMKDIELSMVTKRLLSEHFEVLAEERQRQREEAERRDAE